jgi:hypothetical protein
MARRPTSSKGAPSGPSNAPTGGGSARDRNRVGAAASDSSKRAASVTGEATGDDKPEPSVGGQQQTEDQPRAAHKEKSKPEGYVVMTDRAIIDDGKGGDFKICGVGQEVSLTPERAKQFTDAGVSLITKDEHKKQQEAEKHA